MVYVGLDLHKRYITACAVSAEGTVVAAVRQLSPDWAVLARWLAGLQAPVTVVLEATLYCWWLERQLTGAGYTVDRGQRLSGEAHLADADEDGSHRCAEAGGAGPGGDVARALGT